jgi:hypothetical protein
MDQQTALDVYRYDPITGEIYWADEVPLKYFQNTHRFNQFNSRFAGKLIHNVESNGYLQVRWKGILYMAHRVVWLMEKGVWPSEHIDHKDHDRQNNRIGNLRDVTQGVNNANKQTNKSGHSGVFFQKRSTNRPWMVQVYTQGRYVTQQSFANINDAVAHRDAVRKAHGLPQL